MRRPLVQVCGVSLLLALDAGLLLGGVATAQDKGPPVGMAVSVVTSARRCFRDTVPVSGFVEARSEVQVRPDKDGLILSEVFAQPGDVVVNNQLLARLADPQTQQDVATLNAPAAGTVLETSAVAGAYTSPGAPDPLFRIAVAGELELKADVLAADLPKLKAGQTATLYTPGKVELTGRLRAVDGGLDGFTQLGVARISVPVDARLRAGMFARAEIMSGERCGVAVPLSAILYGRDSPLIETVRNGRVEVRNVTVGVIAGSDVEIRAGLAENEVVIARAGSFLREGDPVRAMPAGSR